MQDQALARKSSAPRLLVVEDDPASRAFFHAALEALPAAVTCAATQAEALAAAPAEPGFYQLCLIDANLPDGSGAQLLAELRRRHGTVAALAHTADNDATTRATLFAAGFAEVLVKPLAATDLQAAVRRHLGAPAAAIPVTPADAPIPAAIPGFDAPLWDDAAALRALGGKVEAMHGLRLLFLRDLPEQLRQIAEAARTGDHATLRQQLHRLKASCGFVGTPRLLAIATTLDQAMPDTTLLAAFIETALATQTASPVPAGVRL